MMTLQNLARLLGLSYHGVDQEFSKLSTDTRSLCEGDVFIALRGDSFDGHDFVEIAEAKKALAIIASRPIKTHLPVFLVNNTRKALGDITAFHRANYAIPVIAITGSCGKTTTKAMLASILNGIGHTLAPESSFNNDIGVPLTLLRLNSNHQYAVIEMGANHRGEIANLCQIARPTVSVITNVGPAHLEGFGSIEGVAEAKGEIYQGLDPEKGIAIINADERFVTKWQASLYNQKIITFGLLKNADFIAKEIKLSDEGYAEFNLISPLGTKKIKLPIMGVHNVMNALAAAAAAYSVGASLEVIAAGLENVSAVSKRLNKYISSKGAVIIDDTYNANPLSVTAALELLSQANGGKIFVFGDMAELGEYAEEMHKQIGIQARELGIEKLYTCGKLSRLTAEAFGNNAYHFQDQSALITKLLDAICPNVTVLVKGSRSSRMENVVKALI